MRKIAIGIVALGFLSSCQQVAGWFGKNETADSTLTSENAHAAFARDESITKENAYSDLFLDSAALENYISKENMDAGKAEKMRNFYRVRNNQFAWFTSDGITEQARGLWSLYISRDEKGKDEPAARIENRMDSLLTNDSLFFSGPDTASALAGAVASKTDSADTAVHASAPYSSSDTTLVQTELTLTAQLVNLATENQQPVTADNFYWLVPRKRMDAFTLADSLLNKEKDSSLWQNRPQYTALKKSLDVYYKAAKDSSWPTLSSAAGLKKGSRSPAVVVLKKRLAATGDYPAADTSNLFSDSLVTAVKTVQERYGFAPTGQISDSLVTELNVPATERMQQILVNMNRVLWLPVQQDSSQIMVNIPSQQLTVFQDSGEVMSMPVIVGKEGSGTVAFSDKITSVVFNPYWNIPQSIVQNEIMPAMKNDPTYLKKHNMEIVKQNDSIPQIRQLPGKDNALGQVKFMFPNTFDIYLHDTPNDELFARQDRTLSHGCIRVAKPDSLAQFVLRSNPEWTPEKIKAAMNSGQNQTVEVKKPVPVSITYYTAWIGRDGKLNFRRDVYGYDQKTAERMFTTTIPAGTGVA